MSNTRADSGFFNRPFFIRLMSWEYWPMHLVYTPIYIYWIFLSLWSRKPMFFAAANPGLDMGGFIGESKKEILDMIPLEWVPRTLMVTPGTSVDAVLDRMRAVAIDFPVIGKPDVGERGFLVEKIKNKDTLDAYLKACPVDVLIQEFVDFPVEVGVLYHRMPGESKGKITSVTLKEFLSVTGDGHSTIEQLIMAYPRALLQLPVLKEKEPELLKEIPAQGKKIELVPIGNHSRGTTFLNGNQHIDGQLIQTFDHISGQIEGVYFGRYDIRCKSITDLKAGKGFKILEINGIKSEPTHIYEPGFSILKAYQILFRQWTTIYRISMENIRYGTPVPTLKEGIQRLRNSLQNKKALQPGTS